jgi:hypothetical protein
MVASRTRLPEQKIKKAPQNAGPFVSTFEKASRKQKVENNLFQGNRTRLRIPDFR